MVMTKVKMIARKRKVLKPPCPEMMKKCKGKTAQRTMPLLSASASRQSRFSRFSLHLPPSTAAAIEQEELAGSCKLESFSSSSSSSSSSSYCPSTPFHHPYSTPPPRFHLPTLNSNHPPAAEATAADDDLESSSSSTPCPCTPSHHPDSPASTHQSRFSPSPPPPGYHFPIYYKPPTSTSIHIPAPAASDNDDDDEELVSTASRPCTPPPPGYPVPWYYKPKPSNNSPPPPGYPVPMYYKPKPKPSNNSPPPPGYPLPIYYKPKPSNSINYSQPLPGFCCLQLHRRPTSFASPAYRENVYCAIH